MTAHLLVTSQWSCFQLLQASQCHVLNRHGFSSVVVGFEIEWGGFVGIRAQGRGQRCLRTSPKGSDANKALSLTLNPIVTLPSHFWHNFVKIHCKLLSEYSITYLWAVSLLSLQKAIISWLPNNNKILVAYRYDFLFFPAVFCKFTMIIRSCVFWSSISCSIFVQGYKISRQILRGAGSMLWIV